MSFVYMLIGVFIGVGSSYVFGVHRYTRNNMKIDMRQTIADTPIGELLARCKGDR